MTVDTEGEELIDAREVAERLGLKNPRTVLDLRIHRLGFPAPVGRQGRTLLWSWAQVELWGATAATLDTASGEARLTVR
jgi:predicted DNA-binding transcriptional regulator AlpA